MTPIGDNTYRARVIGAPDARATYPLAALGNGRLTLVDWRRKIESMARKWPKSAYLGVYNAAGCAVAILSWNGSGLEVVAGAPMLFLNPDAAYATALGTLDQMLRAGAPKDI